MNIVEKNVDKLERVNKDLFNVLKSQDYGSRKVLVDGEKKEVAWNFWDDFDELFDYDKLIGFIEMGLAKGKEQDWIVVEGNDIVEFGMSSVVMMQAKFPNMIRVPKSRLYGVVMSFKKDYDNRYQVLNYGMSLGKSEIKKHRDVVEITQKLRMKEIDKRKEMVWDRMTQEAREEITEVLRDSLVGYTGIVIRGALYRKFLGTLKKALWHFVDEKDSGKTFWMETIDACIDIYQEDRLSNIFGEKAKVDAPSLNRSVLLHQDETTVMFNEFKLLTNSTLKLDLAYAKKQIKVQAPLVIMTSHDDAQDVYSQQFQARVVKVYPGTGSILDKLERLREKGHSSDDIEAVTYMYVRGEIEQALVDAVENPLDLVKEVMDFTEENKLEEHEPTEIVKDELFNLVSSLVWGEDLDRKFDKYGFELGTSVGGSRNSFSEPRKLLIVSGNPRMRKFLEQVIGDKTIFYEINKSHYPSIGFEFKSTISYDNGSGRQKRQKAWVLDVDVFKHEMENIENTEKVYFPDENVKITGNDEQYNSIVGAMSGIITPKPPVFG